MLFAMKPARVFRYSTASEPAISLQGGLALDEAQKIAPMLVEA